MPQEIHAPRSADGTGWPDVVGRMIVVTVIGPSSWAFLQGGPTNVGNTDEQQHALA